MVVKCNLTVATTIGVVWDLFIAVGGTLTVDATAVTVDVVEALTITIGGTLTLAVAATAVTVDRKRRPINVTTMI